MYARVAVLTERGALSREYTYELPEHSGGVPVGACVLVPFQNQVRMGYVVQHLESADVPRVRAAIGRYPSADVPPARVELAEWMAGRWYTSTGACLRMMIPPAIRGRIVHHIRACQCTVAIPTGTAAEVLQAVCEAGAVDPRKLYRTVGADACRRALGKLRDAGLVEDSFQVGTAGGAPKLQNVYLAADPAAALVWIEHNARRKPRQAAILRRLAEAACPLAASELTDISASPQPALKALERDGLVTVSSRQVRRQAREPHADAAQLTLTPGQQQTLDEIEDCLQHQEFREILVFGVTASGKTEVYLRSISRVLDEGRSALVLMPEIALTVHAVGQFRAHFGDMLAVLHSRLSPGERGDEWRRITSGEARVILGPRSAVFAPVSDPGIIIIDEEHEPAFKQDSDPRYHARDICRKIAGDCGIPRVLRSATPSVETCYRAEQGQARLCAIPERIDSRPMPEVHVVDMRTYAREGTLTVLSDPLREALRETLANQGQAILFLNRRAYGTFVLCRECGYVATCPHCAVSLKYHRADRSIRCHHCNWREEVPAKCPSCGGVKIASFGVGTQRVEEELEQAAPEARILRMDRDTTARKDALVEIIEKFRAHQADVLVGTQMVAKGLDFPGVLLVGVINADTGLQMPDYRAAERGFQLLTQVAGRAGRGERAGQVLLQTFEPDHYAVRAASAQDYTEFYRQEILARAELNWPPFGAVARILVHCEDGRRCQELAERAASALLAAGNRVEVMGPSAAPLERLKGQYRWHILLRAHSREDIIHQLDLAAAREWPAEVAVDIDPVSLL